MMKKASIPQVEALRKIFEGKEPNAGLTGRSRAGGFANTMYSLWRNKWIARDYSTTDGYVLTEAGLRAMTPNGHVLTERGLNHVLNGTTS